jgi:hypothetical protein
MDEGTRTGGPVVGAHKRRPDEIREEIEHTREELGATVEALAAKTDVKAQAKAKADDTKRRVEAKADETKRRVEAQVHALKARVPKDEAGRPPLGLIAAVAAGVLLVVIVARR